ncbi:50S ribosomal protein L35ae [Candidatus Woesearchaeota archaeon]|nr:50S ribosomal protein L35ae [Candidatus Woesearchaeota archaeon]
MEGLIANFRRSRHVQTNNQMIILVNNIKNKEDSKKLIGKKVIWKTKTGKEFVGKVANSHGNKGAIRVIFEKGFPGQSLGEKVQVI